MHACTCLQGVGDAFVRIVRDDGVGGLFRGATPTIVRAMALNMGMLASNDQVRSRWDGCLLALRAASCSVVHGAACLACCPAEQPAVGNKQPAMPAAGDSCVF